MPYTVTWGMREEETSPECFLQALGQVGLNDHLRTPQESIALRTLEDLTLEKGHLLELLQQISAVQSDCLKLSSLQEQILENNESVASQARAILSERDQLVESSHRLAKDLAMFDSVPVLQGRIHRLLQNQRLGTRLSSPDEWVEIFNQLDSCIEFFSKHVF